MTKLPKDSSELESIIQDNHYSWDKKLIDFMALISVASLENVNGLREEINIALTGIAIFSRAYNAIKYEFGELISEKVKLIYDYFKGCTGDSKYIRYPE